MTGSRISYDQFTRTAPAARNAMLALSKSAEAAGLDKALIEVVKLRVSQINNCAFCLQHHLNEARRLSVPQEKLDLLASWSEAGIFSDRESAALGWAETLADLAHQTIPDQAYEAVCRHFSEEEV